jgi:hypothetical protein
LTLESDATAFLKALSTLFTAMVLMRTAREPAQDPDAADQVLALAQSALELTLMSTEPSLSEVVDLDLEAPLAAALAPHVEVDLDQDLALAQSELELMLTELSPSEVVDLAQEAT